MQTDLLARVQALVDALQTMAQSAPCYGPDWVYDSLSDAPALMQELRERLEWRTMESAPKDGTLVDLWITHGTYVKYPRIPDCWFSEGKWWWYDEHDDLRRSEVTDPDYWMLRPPAPTNTNDGAA